MSDTVRVRVAVAVDADGWWASAGGSCFEAEVSAALAQHRHASKKAASVVWIEADIPLPLAPQVVAGEVRVVACDE